MSEEIHVEEHSSPIKTPGQLIAVVVLAFVVPITLIAMIAHLALSTIEPGKDGAAMTDAAIAKRLKPVGEVAIVDPNAPVIAKSGKEVYDAVCMACHGTGALNAPKVGDKAAWAKLIKEGLPKLTQEAIKGVKQMPPRGGNPALADIEIARAIVHMANQSGGSFKEPDAKPASAKPSAPGAKAEKPAPAKPAAKAEANKGK